MHMNNPEHLLKNLPPRKAPLRPSGRPAFLALFLCLAAAAATAQENPVIRSRVDQIFVPVTVSTMQNKPVADLSRKDFHVFEDGIEQEILNLAREEVPLNVVFLMDISHSTFLELGAIKAAVRTFAKDLGPDDRVSIITFNNEARLILDWSNDMDRLDKALERVVPKGATVWYDAIYVTLNDLLPNVRGKKVIVSVTDGWDTGSLVSYKEIVEKATTTDVQIYIVSKTSGIKDYVEYIQREYGGLYDETTLMKVMYQCNAELRNLSFETGGRVIDASGTTNLAAIYKDLVQELRLQYYLSYTPHNIMRDGEYRHISVRVDRVGVQVHHRPGYVAK